jgi:hypothetical protein
LSGWEPFSTSTNQDSQAKDIVELKKTQKHQHTVIEKKIEDKAKDIDELRKTQKSQHIAIEKKFENKVDTQTKILHSLVNLIQDMKTVKDTASQSDSVTSVIKQTQASSSPKVSQSDLTDCSYSEECSSQSSDDSVETSTTRKLDENEEIQLKDATDKVYSKKSPNLTESLSPPCKQHENKISDNDADVDDIRRKTRSHSDITSVTEKDDWKGITSKTKRSTKLHLAIFSPAKRLYGKEKYNKDSANYNKFDPKGTILRRSSSRSKPDDPSTEKHKVLRSGRLI